MRPLVAKDNEEKAQVPRRQKTAKERRAQREWAEARFAGKFTEAPRVLDSCTASS